MGHLKSHGTCLMTKGDHGTLPHTASRPHDWGSSEECPALQPGGSEECQNCHQYQAGEHRHRHILAGTVPLPGSPIHPLPLMRPARLTTATASRPCIVYASAHCTQACHHHHACMPTPTCHMQVQASLRNPPPHPNLHSDLAAGLIQYRGGIRALVGGVGVKASYH